MIILDTNVLSALIRQDPEPDPKVVLWLNRQADMSLWTTAITVFEIRYGLAIMPTGKRQTIKLAAFENALRHDLNNRILHFDELAAEHAAALMASRHRGGRIRELRDTMIAGIALSHNATIATRNVRHFDDLDVPVVNPLQA